MELNQLINLRRSIRNYDGNRKVTKEQLDEIMRAVVQAPTWKNRQCGRFYVVESKENLERIRQAILPDYNQESSAGAALVIATFVKDMEGFTEGKPDNELGNMWGAYGLGLQCSYLLLKASDLGLDTLVMGLRDADVIRKELNIPENEIIGPVIALEYRNGEAVLQDRISPDEIMKMV